MTGSVAEAVVTIANTQGRSFNSIHGDGMLSSDGFANMPSWPGIDNNQLNTGREGVIVKGSHMNQNQCDPISTRPNFPANNNRSQFLGARLARTAPLSLQLNDNE